MPTIQISKSYIDLRSMLHDVYSECMTYYILDDDRRYFRRAGAVQLIISGDYYNIKGVAINMYKVYCIVCIKHQTGK